MRFFSPLLAAFSLLPGALRANPKAPAGSGPSQTASVDAQAAPDSKLRAYDLRSAVTEALDQNPDLRQKREHVNEVQAQYMGAWAMLLPQVDSTLVYNRTKGAVLKGVSSDAFGGNAHNIYNFNVKATQALFNIQAFGGVSVADANFRIAEIDSEIGARDLIGQVAKAFSQIIYAQRTHDTLVGLSKVYEESLSAANNLYRNGRSPYLDVLQVRTQIALLVPRIDKADNDVKIATAQLVQLMGSPDIDRIRIQGQLVAPSPEFLKQKVDLTASNLPQIRRIELQKQEVDSERRALLGQHWPSLAAQANWGRNAAKKDDLFNGAATGWAAGVTLSIPIFSGLSSTHQRQQLASRQAQTQIQEVGLRNSLSLQQIQSLENLRLDYSQIKSSEAALDLAHKSQVEGRSNYRLGVIDLPAFLNIQRSVLEASISAEDARIAYVQALVDYFAATGLPMDQLVATLSEGNPQ